MPFPARENPPPRAIAVLWVGVWLGIATLCGVVIFSDNAPFWGKLLFLAFGIFSWIMTLLGIDYYKYDKEAKR